MKVDRVCKYSVVTDQGPRNNLFQETILYFREGQHLLWPQIMTIWLHILISPMCKHMPTSKPLQNFWQHQQLQTIFALIWVPEFLYTLTWRVMFMHTIIIETKLHYPSYSAELNQYLSCKCVVSPSKVKYSIMCEW